VGQTGEWSPDRRSLVYANGTDLFLANSDGTESHKLVSVAGVAFVPVWSPDGSEVRLSVRNTPGVWSLWEVSDKGTNPHRLLAGWHNPPNECCGEWTADGKYFIFQSQGQIWALSEKAGFLRKPSGTPVQLTSSPFSLFTPLPSKDGKKLFVVGQTFRGGLVRYDSKADQVVPFMSGISAEYVTFSKDASGLPMSRIQKARSGEARQMEVSVCNFLTRPYTPSCLAGPQMASRSSSITSLPGKPKRFT